MQVTSTDLFLLTSMQRSSLKVRPFLKSLHLSCKLNHFFQASSRTRYLLKISTISFAASTRLRNQDSGMLKNPSTSSLARPAITTISIISGLVSSRWLGKPSFSTHDGCHLEPPRVGRMLLNSLSLPSTVSSNLFSTKENRRIAIYRRVSFVWVNDARLEIDLIPACRPRRGICCK